MSVVIWSIVLAAIWLLLFGDLTVGGALMGLAVGIAVTAFARLTIARGPAEGRVRRPFPGPVRIARGAIAALYLLGYFLVELLRANLELSRDVLRPAPDFHPGFVSFEAPELTTGETVLMATMISLTPGTITIDVDRDASTLYVHSIYARDVEQIREEFRRYVELILAVRGEGRGHRHRPSGGD